MITALLLAPLALATPFDDTDVGVELASAALPGGALVSGGARLDDADGGAYLGLEARSLVSGEWAGRGSIGLDVLPRWERLDVELGLSLATAGHWREDTIRPLPGVGMELGVGVNLGRLHGQWRSVMPLGEEYLMDVVQEHRWRLGFDVVEQVRVFGELLLIDDEPGVLGDGLAPATGIGARVTF